MALLILDVINDLEFEEGRQLLKQALPMAKKIAALKKKGQDCNIPIIYVNDNFGQWRSDLSKQISHCLNDGVRGEPIARLLAPDHSDYFVLKPKSSGFFGTTLHTLLKDLGSNTLILTGMAADVCVLFTAHDAHLRGYKIVVPADCVASNTANETKMALENMRKAAHAEIARMADIDLKKLAGDRAGAKLLRNKHKT